MANRLTAGRLRLGLTVLALQLATVAGFVKTFVAAAAGGNQFVNNGRVLISVANASGGAITVTIKAQTKCSQGFLHDQVTNVAAGATVDFPPLDTLRFNESSTGNVWILYSSVTSVMVAAVQLP